MNEELLRALELAIRDTSLHVFMRQVRWIWPALESLHFIGMSLLIGTIGMFDLRLLGFARSVPITGVLRNLIMQVTTGDALVNHSSGHTRISRRLRLSHGNPGGSAKVASAA